MSGGETKTVQKNDPYKPAQPLLKSAATAANNLFKSGDVFQPYTGSTVSPFAPQTTAGMGAIEGQANSAIGSGAMNNPMDFLTQLYQSGGMSGDMQGVADQWRKTASGDEMNSANPYFEDVLRRTLEDTSTNTNLGMSGAGRYGSGMHAGVLADRLGGISSEARMGEYNNQQGRMDAARGLLANMGQQGIQNQFGATSAMPGAWQTSQMPGADLIKLGTMNQNQNAMELADQERIWRETQAAPRQSIDWLSGIGAGIGGTGGTQTQTQQQSQSPLNTALGLGMAATSLFGNPFGAAMGGSMMGSVGANGIPTPGVNPFIR